MQTNGLRRGHMYPVPASDAQKGSDLTIGRHLFVKLLWYSFIELGEVLSL